MLCKIGLSTGDLWFLCVTIHCSQIAGKSGQFEVLYLYTVNVSVCGYDILTEGYT